MKVYIVNEDTDVLKAFPELEITTNLKDAKIVIFGDGPIVSPSLYKAKKENNIEFKCDINRDRSDKSIYTKLTPDQIAVGIGRGACFLAIMNGAKLIQKCIKSNPERSYLVKFHQGTSNFEFPAISNWVQSINLMDCSDFRVYGVSKSCRDYITTPEIKRFMSFNGDPEFISFNKPGRPISFCIQFHPEWMPNAFINKIIKNQIYECANS